MTPRMVEVSRWDGKDWVPRATGVFHGFYTDHVERQAGIGNYPVAMVEWEDGKLESCPVHTVRFLVPTLELEGDKEQVQASWLSKEMWTPAKGFPAIKDALKVWDTVELPADLPECRGLRLRGLLISFPRHGVSEVLLELDLLDTPRRQFIHVPTYRLVKVPE